MRKECWIRYVKNIAMKIDEIIRKTNAVCSSFFRVISFFCPIHPRKDSLNVESDSYKLPLVFPKNLLKQTEELVALTRVFNVTRDAVFTSCKVFFDTILFYGNFIMQTDVF